MISRFFERPDRAPSRVRQVTKRKRIRNTATRMVAIRPDQYPRGSFRAPQAKSASSGLKGDSFDGDRKLSDRLSVKAEHDLVATCSTKLHCERCGEGHRAWDVRIGAAGELVRFEGKRLVAEAFTVGSMNHLNSNNMGLVQFGVVEDQSACQRVSDSNRKRLGGHAIYPALEHADQTVSRGSAGTYQ